MQRCRVTAHTPWITAGYRNSGAAGIAYSTALKAPLRVLGRPSDTAQLQQEPLLPRFQRVSSDCTAHNAPFVFLGQVLSAAASLEQP